MAAIGSSIFPDLSGAVVSLVKPSTGKIENVTIALANTEQSHTFPATTKCFFLKARGAGSVKISHDVGTSGTSYVTISPGSGYRSPEFDTPSKTIYFQSPVAGLVLELESWA